MTRSMTAAAVCAILLVTVQIDTAAQSKAPAKTPAKTAPAKAVPAKAAPAKTAAARIAAAPVPGDTLTGCLEADGAKYKLTGLKGTEVPKGRSWKTGFITKKSKDVEVVGASAALKLKDHVGHKVSVVGVKDGDTHFQARSVKQLAGSCS